VFNPFRFQVVNAFLMKRKQIILNSPKALMRTLLITFLILFMLKGLAFSMVYTEVNGLVFYFSEDEKEIAERLTEEFPEMESFLSLWGLPIQRPLHVILDDNIDAPEVLLHIIPHKEIRIPVRAPGVLEDGYTESDPWAYFMFKGLCLQSIYGIRSGVPEFFHMIFGEIISPNVIMPPWVENGICDLLYGKYRHKEFRDPFAEAIFRTSPLPDLDIVSNHPQIWPGNYAPRIYGGPFIEWLNNTYGWEKVLDFIRLHGRGIIPIEIDLKAKEVFGKTGIMLWKEFQEEHPRGIGHTPGLLISGYWNDPFVFWNQSGVYPGKLKIRERSRYGYVDPDGSLWISEYEKASILIKYSKGSAVSTDLVHIWDPGPGGVAVTRKGHRPYVMISPDDSKGGFGRLNEIQKKQVPMIPAPSGIIQLSGPVRDRHGRIAVAGNLEGNWDIWVFDEKWYRITDTPSIEMDPWWDDDTLMYASNISGKFQIHSAQGQVTYTENGAILPRQGKFLNLTETGWQIQRYTSSRLPLIELQSPHKGPVEKASGRLPIDTYPYNPFKSLRPNYIRPDIFAGVDDFQLGIATKSRDVAGDWALDSGVRYSFDLGYIAAQAAFQIKNIGTRFTRYPLSYSTALAQTVDESRNEIRLFWRPIDFDTTKLADKLSDLDKFENFQGIEFSFNWRNYKPLSGEGSTENESWTALAFTKSWGSLQTWGNLEFLSESRQSLSGGISFLFGDQTFTSIHMMAGQTWGDPVNGHNTFRIGGNVIEGYFTRRPSRLFPIRGFDSNILEASKAASGGIEVFWPMANLQTGYQTLPLFFHRLRLGTFVDAGFAGESISGDDLLVGGGFELITTMEIAWGNLSSFRIGISWPFRQPEYLNQKGPLFIIQIGRPL